MKKLLSLVSLIAIMALAASCNCGNNRNWSSKSTNPQEFAEDMAEQFEEFVSDEYEKFINSELSKKAPVKKPAFRERELKNELRYQLLIAGADEESYRLQVGHFEIRKDDLEFYALLCDNGLITLSTKAVKVGDTNKYSIWADVALTSEGKKYISADNRYDNVKALDKVKYMNILHPAKDRNAYGELAEEPVSQPEIINLFSSFYRDVTTASVNQAVKAHGESEFTEAYARITRLDSYLKELDMATMLPKKAFTAGRDIDSTVVDNLKVFRVTKYVDCYKVYLSESNSVMFILTPNKSKIFDLVINAPKNVTLRTRNAEWTDAQITTYEERVAAPAVEPAVAKELNAKKVWYAPGLILAGENDASRYVYSQEKALSIEDYVYVRLYDNVIDRIYNVKVTTEEADDDLGNDYEYTASATVVLKKVKITPFQLVLQKAGEVGRIDRSNLYSVKEVEFTHYDDRAWGLPR